MDESDPPTYLPTHVPALKLDWLTDSEGPLNIYSILLFAFKPFVEDYI